MAGFILTSTTGVASASLAERLELFFLCSVRCCGKCNLKRRAVLSGTYLQLVKVLGKRQFSASEN